MPLQIIAKLFNKLQIQIQIHRFKSAPLPPSTTSPLPHTNRHTDTPPHTHTQCFSSLLQITPRKVQLNLKTIMISKKNAKLCIKEKGNLLFIFDIFHIRHLKLRNFTLHSVLICYYLLFILEIKFEYNLVLESILSEYLWSFIRCWKKIAHVKYTLNIL